MKESKPKDIRHIMLETDLVGRALRKAVVNAMIRHKRPGNPIVVWREGKVVWIPAEEIEIPDLEPDEEQSDLVFTPSGRTDHPRPVRQPSDEGSGKTCASGTRERIGMLPDFDEFGNLPPGIHPATIEEIILRFGIGSPERDVEGQELLEFVKWARLAGVRRLIIDGSFVTAKEASNDVDLVILPGPDYPGDQARADGDDDVSWPFLHVLVAADDEDLRRWVTEDFGTDRLLRSKGVVEVIL